jgi:hypothetical protein
MIKLSQIPTNDKSVDKDKIKAENKELAIQIGILQNVLMASESKALLSYLPRYGCIRKRRCR